VKKYRVSPSIRGFHVNELLDNTLYLVCVVTRGSSYTRAPNEILGGSNSKKQQVNILRIVCIILFLFPGAHSMSTVPRISVFSGFVLLLLSSKCRKH
jgi:hypothetical protein